MEITSTQKYLIVSPKKLRPIARLVKKLSPQKALDTLPFIKRMGSLHIEKALKTAVANAKEKNINIEDLTIKDIQINEGPRYKRGRAVARGRWHPYKKRSSHIKVVLLTKDKPKEVKKQKAKTKKADKKKVPHKKGGKK